MEACHNTLMSPTHVTADLARDLARDLAQYPWKRGDLRSCPRSHRGMAFPKYSVVHACRHFYEVNIIQFTLINLHVLQNLYILNEVGTSNLNILIQEQYLLWAEQINKNSVLSLQQLPFSSISSFIKLAN